MGHGGGHGGHGHGFGRLATWGSGGGWYGLYDVWNDDILDAFGAEVPHSPALGALTGRSLGGCPQRRLAALQELREKSLGRIQEETAYTWAYRASAAHGLAVQAQNRGEHALAHHWMHDATEYAHEAIEHAALCGNPQVLPTVRHIVQGAI